MVVAVRRIQEDGNGHTSHLETFQMLLANRIQVRHSCNDQMRDVWRRGARSGRGNARNVSIRNPGAFKALEIQPVKGCQLFPAIFLLRAGADHLR